jgi:membrane protease YdiL (CAAX protease family)
MKHLTRALDNQNQWWKYLIVFLAGFISANFIGAIPLIVIIASKIIQSGGVISPNPENYMDFSVYGIDPNLGLFLLILPFAVGLLTMALLFKPLHKRNIVEVINGRNRVRWLKFFFAMGIWITILTIFLLADFVLDPDNFDLTFNLSSFIPLVFISISLIPIQTTYEEVLFRGYLAQGIAAWTRSRWWVIIIPTVIFGLLHSLNPEIQEFGFWYMMPQYMIFGFLFGLITVLDDGIEAAMGAHAGNNIFGSIFITHKASTLQTPALLEQLQVNPLREMILLIMISVIFLIILSRKYQWNYTVLNQKVSPAFNRDNANQKSNQV